MSDSPTISTVTSGSGFQRIALGVVWALVALPRRSRLVFILPGAAAVILSTDDPRGVRHGANQLPATSVATSRAQPQDRLTPIPPWP